MCSVGQEFNMLLFDMICYCSTCLAITTRPAGLGCAWASTYRGSDPKGTILTFAPSKLVFRGKGGYLCLCVKAQWHVRYRFVAKIEVGCNGYSALRWPYGSRCKKRSEGVQNIATVLSEVDLPLWRKGKALPRGRFVAKGIRSAQESAACWLGRFYYRLPCCSANNTLQFVNLTCTCIKIPGKGT